MGADDMAPQIQLASQRYAQELADEVFRLRRENAALMGELSQLKPLLRAWMGTANRLAIQIEQASERCARPAGVCFSTEDLANARG